MTSFRAAVVVAVSIQSLILGVAVAGDGRWEINQICAVQSGCFPGDTPGFPVTITEPGGYVLTGNLTVSSTNGIDLETGDVDLDLNGFRIEGPSDNTGIFLPQIFPPINDQGRVRIHDGAVRGFESAVADDNARAYHTTVERLMAFNQSGDGIRLRRASTVRECHVRDAGGNGLYVTYSIIADNVISGAGSHGIHGSHSTLTGNYIDNAAGSGIFASNAMIRGSFIDGTGSHGIETSLYACTITDNVILNATSSGIDAYGTIRNNAIVSYGLHGIRSLRGQVSHNTIDGTTGAPTGNGMSLGFRVGYSFNSVTTLNTPVSGGNDAGGNVCNGVLDGC